MKTLTYLVPNDMRREPGDDMSALNGAIQRGANVLAASVDDASETRLDAFLAETAEKVAPGLPPPRIVFSGRAFASAADIAAITPEQVERAMQAIAEGDHGSPDLAAVLERSAIPIRPVDWVDAYPEMIRILSEAERAAHPLITITVDPLKPTPEEARLYRELTDRAADEIRRLLCGSLTDSVVELPPDWEVEYLEADAGELPYALAVSPGGPCHDETKPTG